VQYSILAILLASAFCRVIFNTLFGISTTYWMAIGIRLVLGALNGLLAPIKVRLISSFNSNIMVVTRIFE
jgi:hypothetical protein